MKQFKGRWVGSTSISTNSVSVPAAMAFLRWKKAVWLPSFRMITSSNFSSLVQHGITRFDYIYDFGDNWQRQIIIEEARPREPEIDYPILVEGARRCPPEDCGGSSGFQNFLKAITDPSHPEHFDALDWYEDQYDPDDIEREVIDIQLSRIARSRKGGMKARGRPRK